MSGGKCSDTNFCSLDLGQLPAFWAPWFPAMFPSLGRGRITTTTDKPQQNFKNISGSTGHGKGHSKELLAAAKLWQRQFHYNLTTYEVHSISFQTFLVWTLLLTVHTKNSSPLQSILLRHQCTCCTVPTTSGKPPGSLFV